MIIGKIENGIVLDHIKAGRGMELYRILGLDSSGLPGGAHQECRQRQNAGARISSRSTGSSTSTWMPSVMWIRGSRSTSSKAENWRSGTHIDLPEEITNVIHCKNPRCITTTEQELPHVFKLTDREKRVYRCIYCESKAK